MNFTAGFSAYMISLTTEVKKLGEKQRKDTDTAM